MNSLTILGSGTSAGVPMIGCNCLVCNSQDPSNNRLRTSVLLHTANSKTILVDTTPDLRTQFLREKIKYIDAAIITHDHADHTHGMDDLRPLCHLNKMTIPIYCSAKTAQGLKKKFDYIFERKNIFTQDRPILGGGIPMLDLVEFSDGKHFVADEDFEFFSLPHGYGLSSGFIHQSMAYVVDCHDIPTAVVQRLKEAQLDLLVLDCVQPEPHQTHLGWEKARTFLEYIRPKRAGLIHMNHEWDHEKFSQTILGHGIDWAAPLRDGDVLQYEVR